MSFPDSRGWALIGLFTLTGGILLAIFLNPALEKNELFSSLATLIVGAGGFLGAIGFLFGSSQSGAKKDEAISNLAANQNPTPQPQKDA